MRLSDSGAYIVDDTGHVVAAREIMDTLAALRAENARLQERVNDLENACMVHHDEVARLKAEVQKLRRYHEAILNTLGASKSPWIQKVWRNAKSAYTGINRAAKGE